MARRSVGRRRDEGLARVSVPLDDPARPRDPFGADWDRRDAQYDNLIRTVLPDSRRVSRPVLSGSRYSPDVRVRATRRAQRSPSRSFRQVLAGLNLPRRALVCAKRVIRKEVLFALGRSGKGSRSRRRIRRVDSTYRC